VLPNYAPLIIAEQFGALEALYPGRIDLSLGRAPGTDHPTVRALRRHPSSGEAANLGLPFAFASTLRRTPSWRRCKSIGLSSSPLSNCNGHKRMVCVNVITAEHDEACLFTSLLQLVTDVFRGRRGRLPPPIDDIEARASNRPNQ